MDHKKEISTDCCVVIGFLEHDDGKLATDLLLGNNGMVFTKAWSWPNLSSDGSIWYDVLFQSGKKDRRSCG